MKKQVVRISLNGEVGTNEILGKWLAKDGSTFWQDGTLIDCMRHGKWAVGDEINAALPEVLMALNPILDDGRSIVLSEKDGELVVPHPDFRFFATMNPPEGYAGTKDMNSALMDRFGIVMKLGYYKPSMEMKILKYHTEIEDVLSKVIVDVGNAIRGLRRTNKVFFPCGTRTLVNWAKLIVIDGNSLETTFKYSVLNKCSDEDAKIIYDEVTRSIKIKIDWKASGEDNVRRLTDEMANDIAQISEMKKTLQAYTEEIKSKAKVKESVA
jgi:midasin (ATPase involved in ribosome maturation)